MVNEELNLPAARALRAIQKYDELAGIAVGHRDLLIEAMTALGDQLELVCTGTTDGGGFYDHSGDTCPIHEWLVPDDHAEAHARPSPPWRITEPRR